MNFTTIPRSLVYRERKRLEDFGIHKSNQLNTELYELLKLDLKATLGNSEYSKLFKTLFNEAYYLCTIILMDRDAIMHFREYVDAILIGHSLPGVYKERFRKIVCAICYVYLEDMAKSLDDIFTIRRHLRSCSYEYMPIIDATTGIKRPQESDFQPVELTDELLSKVDWKEVTDNYDFVKSESILRTLGRNSFEKKRLVLSIYSSISASGRMYAISYNLDKLLFKTFEQYGGNVKDLVNLKEKQMLNENKEDLASRIKQLEQENLAQKNRIRDLEIRNNVLTKDRADLEKKVKELEYKNSVTFLANYNKKNNEETLRRQIAAEMEDRMQKLQDKLGQTTVKLSSLVEGVKRYTRFRGLDSGKDIFFSLNYLLMKEPVWVDNTEELENFFIEAEEKSKKAIVEIENKQGGLIQISSKDSNKGK